MGAENPLSGPSMARVLRRKRTVIAAALLAAVAGVVVWWMTSESPRAHAESRLSALGAPVPGLPPADGPVVTQPSCDAFDHCVSAALTWHASTPHRSFASVSRAVARWAARNHLGRPIWDCGPHLGLFGSFAHAGCQAGFDPGLPSPDAVFVAVTLSDPRPLQFDPAKTGSNGGSPDSLRVHGASVASVSAQVVRGVHAIG